MKMHEGTVMKRGQAGTPAQKKYRKTIRRRKALLYLVLLLSFVLVLNVAVAVFASSYRKILEPQVNRAVIQVARLLPQLKKNEAMLRDSYDQMVQSWETIFDPDNEDLAEYIAERDKEYEQLVGDTLSWMNRVTKLQVGRDGFILVADKETSRILAHPNEDYVGRLIKPFDQLSEGEVISIGSIRPWTKPEDLHLEFEMIEPTRFARQNVKSADDLITYVNMTLFGCVIDNGDTYILCGVPLTEMFSYVLGNALIFCLFFLILMWLFVRWICLVTDSRRETARSFRPKLFSCATIVCLVLLGISWYTQILSNVTNDLKTMGKHANVAVETLNTYKEQRKKLNDWLDDFYLTQCGIAAQLVTEAGRDNLTRQNMQDMADALNVAYVYAFDQKGKVAVTNSPFDHFSLGDGPEAPTYGFHALLDGVYSMITEPVEDERYQEYVQYAGVSTRNEKDLCDGFVMIDIDPTMRDELLSPLTVDTVMENLIIGLPEYAIAVDKDTLEIVATTGLGFRDASIESLGLSEESLTEDFSGFLKIGGTLYYAGVSESEDLYLLPIARRTGNLESFLIALRLTVCAVITSLILILLTLLRYQKDVVDAYPAGEEFLPEEKASAQPEAESSSRSRFSGISNIFSTQEKRGLEERWGMSTIPRSELTPEQRILRTVYRLLLVFCLFILLPTLYLSLNRGAEGIELNNLAYVISGNWQKGFNIFALTSCIFLLCAMYVASVLINRILYLIARVSDMRVETVCLLLRNALKYILVIIFVYYGLAQFGVDTKTLLASAGILSLMISFGAKDLVGDVIAGFFTLFEGSYKVGDFVTVGSWYGMVTEIGLRTTKVRYLTDTKIFNNSSMRDIINSDPVARMILNMPISYDADLHQVEAILTEELPKLKIPGMAKPPFYAGVQSFEDSSILLRIFLDVNSVDRDPAMRALKREVRLIFDRRGIEIPFNQIVVHEAKEIPES